MIINGERALATIRVVQELRAIPDADAIEAARVDGWWAVVKTGSFNVGDLAIYIEPDAWVPTAIAPFLSKGKKPKVYEGVEGERLRTVRLRKQLSQGLLLSLDDVVFESLGIVVEGADVTEELGILKWERPIPAQMRGAMAGYFPSFIRKTDQERIQNRPELLEDQDRLWEISLKMDGSSTTIYQNDGFPGVCSRNIDLKYFRANSTWC
jgi:RNA ligase (TIGR02306 family)